MLDPYILMYKKSPTQIIDIRAIPDNPNNSSPKFWYVLDDLAKALDPEPIYSEWKEFYPFKNKAGSTTCLLIVHEDEVNQLISPASSLGKLLRLFQRVRPRYFASIESIEFSNHPEPEPKKEDEAAKEGREAFFSRLPRAANPYPSDDLKHLSWSNGWMSGYLNLPES